MTLITEVRLTVVRHVRSYRFLLIAVISILLGYLCVPEAGAGYEIFYLAGVRGVYNSAWLGAMAALLPTLLLWLPGFFLLHGSISEDKRLGIWPLIAASPVSKLRYMAGKAAAHFVVLASLALLFMIALIGMQFVRQEEPSFVFSDYLLPFLLLTLPYLMVLAALTVFLDAAASLRGIAGHVIAFVLTLVLIGFSVAKTDNTYELFGIGLTLAEMGEGARQVYPNLPPNIGSFGYYRVAHATPTFVWEGFAWSYEFMLARLVWMLAAVLLVVGSAIFFKRMEEGGGEDRLNKDNRSRRQKAGETELRPGYVIDKGYNSGYNTAGSYPFSLTGITEDRKLRWNRMLTGEIRLMISGRPIWWYVLGGVGLTGSLSIQMPPPSNPWPALMLLLLLPIWSQMGSREKLYFTSGLLDSSCSPMSKWWATWTAGLLLAMTVSSGMLVRMMIAMEWLHTLHMWIGLAMMNTLALILGSWSGSRRLFEAVLIIWLYLGPLSQIGPLDFLGWSGGSLPVYLLLTLLLMLIGVSWGRERRAGQ